jgi:hypothetical protein
MNMLGSRDRRFGFWELGVGGHEAESEDCAKMGWEIESVSFFHRSRLYIVVFF